MIFVPWLASKLDKTLIGIDIYGPAQPNAMLVPLLHDLKAPTFPQMLHSPELWHHLLYLDLQ